MSTIHIPVLSKETIEVLIDGGGKTYIDCTVGTGGHSVEILTQTPNDVIVIGIDKDGESLKIARKKLEPFGSRSKLLKGGFEDIEKLIEPLDVGPISGILFDLGMSSFQLDAPKRGFSFREDGPLDMRFDTEQELTAEEVIKTTSQEKLLELFKKLGEEKWSRRLSRVITERKANKEFETTLELSDFIRKNIPRRAAHKTLARVFQAIRITVNNELEDLKKGLLESFNILDIGGRMTLITYHSLEDRIVKNFFRLLKSAELITVINPRCARPSKSERLRNRRSRSARLRAMKKIKEIPEKIAEMEKMDMEKEWEGERSD